MGSLHTQHPSLWIGTTEASTYPPLDGDLSVDAAVIGAGITGLTAANLLRRHGVRVAVLESGRVASGATGNTTGKVSALQGLRYADIFRRIGEEAARTYADANLAAVEQVQTLIDEGRIDCGFRRQSAYSYTEDPERISDIENEVQTAQKIGLHAAMTRETALPFPVEAAIRLDNQALLHPRQYCLALAKNLGDVLYENTRALNVEDKNGAGSCTVRTDRGKVHADFVLITTLLPFVAAGEFYKRTSPSRSYLLAARTGGAGIDGMYLGVDQNIRTICPAADGEHLILGGAHHPTGQGGDTQERYQEIEDWAQAHFDIQAIDYRWSAQDYLADDGIPYIGRATPRNEGLLVATGLEKWGLSNGTAAAMILTDIVLGRQNPWLPLFDATRKGYRPRAHGRGVSAKHARKQAQSPAQLAENDGAVFEVDKDKIAVFRQPGGELLAVSAVCTHLGCTLNFNPAEQSWDCPCHGSRFHVDGRVIDGPAVKDLEKKAVPE